MRQAAGIVLTSTLAACGAPNLAAPTSRAAPGWQTPARLGPTAGSSTSFPSPTVAADSLGRAIAGWVEYTPVTTAGETYQRMDVRAARFEPAKQWGSPELLGQASGGVVTARAVMNGRGNAVMVWSGPFVSFFAPAVGWTPPSVIPLSAAHFPNVALAEDGAAIGIVQADDVTGPGAWWERQRLWAAPLSPAGWGIPQIISASEAPDYEPLALGVDGRGNATAVWVESGPPAFHHEEAALWTNRWLRGVGWGTRERLATLPNVTGWSDIWTAFDMHLDGHVAALWQGPGGLQASIYGADGWTMPTIVGGTDIASPRVRMLPDGRAIAVWASYGRGIEGITFEKGRGWSAPDPLDGRPLADAGSPGRGLGLGVDGSGRGWVVWAQDERIRAARFSARGGWELPVALQSTGARAESPQVAVSPGGEAFAVWAEGSTLSSSREIWAALYVPEGR